YATATQAPEIIDEEVVIDRYAALDAAIGRLARTMRASRALSRTDDQASGAATQGRIIEEHETTRNPPVFDIVLPEEPPHSTDSTSPAPASNRQSERSNSGKNPRRYEFLFSELRRRRMRA